MYLAKSESYLSSMERIPAPRGKILDRYGRPIVSNRLGFSVSFTKSGLSDDELNDLILNTVTLLRANDDEYIDTFPIIFDGNEYAFSYRDYTGDELDTKVRNAKFALSISDNLNAEECIDVLIDKFNIDKRYSKRDIRDIISVRYEMVMRDFSDTNQ